MIAHAYIHTYKIGGDHSCGKAKPCKGEAFCERGRSRWWHWQGEALHGWRAEPGIRNLHHAPPSTELFDLLRGLFDETRGSISKSNASSCSSSFLHILFISASRSRKRPWTLNFFLGHISAMKTSHNPFVSVLEEEAHAFAAPVLDAENHFARATGE